MTARFLLACHDDNALQVTTADAGRTLTCPCGKQIVVPTLREVRQLPPAPSSDTSSAAKPATRWSATQGLLFSLGVLLVLAAVAWSIRIGWLYSQLDMTPPQVDKELVVKEAEQLTPAQTLVAWEQVQLAGPLEARRTPRHLVHQERAKTLRIRWLLAAGLGLLGIASAVGSFFFKTQPPQLARRKKPTGR